MKVGKAGVALIQSFESCAKKHPSGHFEAYMPTKDDVPTIGWGSTGKDIKMGLAMSQQECDDRFAADLAAFAKLVDDAIDGAKTTQNQFDAMVALAYNIGMGRKQHGNAKMVPGFVNSSVLRSHLAKDYAAAAHAFGMWNKQAGKVLAGLTRRRKAEADLYLTA